MTELEPLLEVALLAVSYDVIAEMRVIRCLVPCASATSPGKDL